MKELAHSEAPAPAAVQDIRLFRLTWPIFLEILLFMLMGSVDTFMLSRVSDDAVSAVGAANHIVSIAILVLEVIGNGAAIVLAQYIGSRQLYEAAKVTAVSIVLNGLIGAAMSLLFVLLSHAMLKMMNLQGDILAYADTYLLIVGGGILVQALINIMAAIIRTYGFTKEVMFVAFGMNLAHVIANYALIFGHWGFPALGVMGAAISTVASKVVCLILLVWMMRRLMEVRVGWRDYWRLPMHLVRKILKIGIPSAFEQVMYQTCQLVFVFYTTFLGATALASKQYASNISMYIYLFSAAVGIGTSIMTGRLVGAGRPDDAYRRVWKSVLWALSITVVVDAVIIGFRVPLMSLFTDNADIIRLGSQVIVLSILLETGRTCNMVVINSLRASGDATFPVYMGVLSMVCMSLPLGYLLVFQLNMGLVGVWLAIAADEWLRAIIMFFRWRSRKWEAKRLVEPNTPQIQPTAAAPAGNEAL
ncbi:MATE family efflux transporter [Paenibacillus hodogayensis]|uniref:MATE family efflux transporter n=1 Tax=Paenibacillus hodogayensis TaxID=279208 RepID=A0ABV5VTH1_9BACL